MNINKLIEILSSNLLEHLHKFGPRGDFSEVYQHSLLPAGKLFRPLLAVMAYHESANQGQSLETIVDHLHNNKDIALYASFLESHHVYTLIHDDLPCMDDDNERRGRAASHVKFGQWQALLAGDGLSLYSIRLLSNMKSPQALNLIKIATWATGPKGLIHGQYLDLSKQMKTSFETVLETHLLKTARLIQLSLIGGQVLADGEINNQTKKYWKFGKALGLVFQLIDDLDDLLELSLDAIDDHERDINPWLNFKDKSFNVLKFELNVLQSFLADKPDLSKYVATYLEKSRSKIKDNAENYYRILNTDENGLLPILASLNLTCHH